MSTEYMTKLRDFCLFKKKLRPILYIYVCKLN